MKKTTAILISGCLLSAIAAFGHPPADLDGMAERLRSDLGAGVGIMWPDTNTPLLQSYGAVAVPEDGGNFPADFLEALVSHDGVSYPVTARIEDDFTGWVTFRNVEGTAIGFAPPEPGYSRDWIIERHGGSVSPHMDALRLPSHVAGQFDMVAESEMGAYRAMKLAALQAKGGGMAAMAAPAEPLGDLELRITDFQIVTNVLHFSAEVGDVIATAYAGTNMFLNVVLKKRK